MARKRGRDEPVMAERIRCAIYTRKSTEEGLDQEYNTLDAQRDAGEAYVASQKHEGWVALRTRYDDGGFSGGNLERPALQRLLTDIERGKVDIVVVYKVDRLSRSLLDFSKIVDIFGEHDVSFVSVTQQFNTATSMGRLMLNVLLSFAQFEREIIGERIRDKVAAAKRKGKHTGGKPIFGYDVDPITKRLVVNEKEAEIVRHIFERFCEVGSGTNLSRELNDEGYRTKEWQTRKGKVTGGARWNKAHIYRLLNNPKYIGKVPHHDLLFEGEHEGIVPRELWTRVQTILAENSRVRGNRTRAKTPALLKGLLRCGHCGGSMGATFTKSKGRTYRYYVCIAATKNGMETCPVRRVAAGEIETAVVNQLRAVFRTPEIVARTYREAKTTESEALEQLRRDEASIEEELARFRKRATHLAEATGEDDNGAIALELRDTGNRIDKAEHRLAEVRAQIKGLVADPLTQEQATSALEKIDPVWDELFPREQARIVELLVEHVTVDTGGLEVRLRGSGLRTLVAEVEGRTEEAAT